jgi:hypothetical protein
MRKARRWVVLGACVAAIYPGAVTGGQSVSLNEVVARLGKYLDAYERQLSAVVAVEEYDQEYTYSVGRQSVTQKRRLISDFLFLRLSGERPWLGIRDVRFVDGSPVPRRTRQLDAVVVEGGNQLLSELTLIATENARFNLGDVVRTVNVPTEVLALLHPRNQSRFAFRRDGEEAIAGQRLWRLGFREVAKPALIKTVQGADQPASGLVWVAPDDGAVIRTRLVLGGDLAVDYLRTQITVDFEKDARLGLRVPVRMAELYSRPGMRIFARASYRDFQQFQTGARISPN